MNDPHPEQLSSAGLARREAMLDELIDTMRQTHRARRLRRRAVAAAGCICLVLVLMQLALPGGFVLRGKPRIADDSPNRLPHLPSAVPQERRACVTVVVQTDPGVVDRYRAHPTERTVRMDDRMLLDTLASINRPAGLVRFGNRTLLSAPVTDAELGLRQ